MSGPIVPPLEVTEVDGSPDGRPITKIIVSNGDLTVSGRTATIDTTGSGGTPGGSDTEVQYNNAGAFAGDAGFTVETAGGGDTTKVRVGGLILYNDVITTRQGNATLSIHSDGTGEIILRSSNEAGGTFTDSTVGILSNTNSDTAYLKFRSSSTTDDGGLMKDGNQDIILRSLVTNKDIDLQVNGTGIVEVENQTTDNPTTFQVAGNGTGKPVINLKNDTQSASLEVTTNNKLTVKGATDSFVFDVSSATGGITFPDATTQTTAASGVSFPLDAPNGGVAAPSYSFTNDTTTGMYFYTDFGNSVLSLTVDGGRVINVKHTGAVEINDAYTLPTAVTGANDYVLTAQTDGSTAWAEASGGVAATAGVVLTDPTVIAAGYTKTPTSQRIGGGVLSYAAGELSASDPFGFPWVSPHTGTIADITMSVSTAQAGRTLEGGIYESDSDGWPSTLLASFDIALDSTGEITQTSFTGTPAVTKGSNYWFIHIADGATSTTARVYARENNVTYGGFQPIMGVHTSGYFGNSIPTGAIIDGETSLPATVTTAAIQTTNKDLLQYVVGW